MALLTAEQILSANDVAFEDVEIPEWGGSVRIRTLLTSDVTDAESQLVQDGSPRDDLQLYLLALSIVDETGKRLFATDSIRRLKDKSATSLTKLIAAMSRVNGGLSIDAAKKN